MHMHTKAIKRNIHTVKHHTRPRICNCIGVCSVHLIR